MKLAFTGIVLLAMLFVGEASCRANALASDETFDRIVRPFLQQYCTDCHNSSDAAGEVDLTSISRNVASDESLQLWQNIQKQLVLDEMPPADHEQPASALQNDVISWIHRELQESGNASDILKKLESPEFGNLVNHQRLFSGEVTTKPFSPARLWRTSPNVFENIKGNYGAEEKHLRQPFIVDDKEGIKEYANLLFADSAVVNVLLMNAGISADRLMEKDQAFKSIARSKEHPDESVLVAALNQHFKRVVYREPTDEETGRYVQLFKKSALDGDRAEALRVTLMAIMLHHESVYRVEIGLGAKEADGRRMLSPTELAFAVSYALTDERPDEALMQAARDGELASRGDVREQVARILQSDSIDKPRILRFFQEFFGYAHAHKVFKDEKRSGGFAYYGENYPEMYERDADFFVMNILEKDQDVFRELLTSDEYYLLNRQTFRNTVYDFYQSNKEQLDRDEFPESKQKELLDRLNLKGWHELNKKYHLHNFNRGFNGSVQAIKQIVKEARAWKNTKDEEKLRHGMQPLYKKYPMVYDLRDDEQDFLLPQPYKRPNRAGMLTHPAWLIAHSLNDSTDPIRRGKWIRERLLAGVVPDVPITVDASIPEDHTKTLRERLAVTEQQECWRCHQKMNPLGYPFEIYDDFGRFRSREELDKLPKKNGQSPSKPVNAIGFLEDWDDNGDAVDVQDALELIAELADSDRVRQSIIRHVFRYFMGRNEMISDSATLIAADRAYVESGGSFNALLMSLLTSDSFLYRK
ncbi:MAG: DUF1588 domain-containing protein [Planctomycetota bacterium]